MSKYRLSFVTACVFAFLVALAAPANAQVTSPEDEIPEFRDVHAPEPPDGKWLRDGEGRQYFLDLVPKAHAQKIGSNTIRTLWGITLTYDRETEEGYLYRYYRTTPTKKPDPKSAQPDEAAIDELYKGRYPGSTRVIAKSFDTGLPKSGQWRDGFAVADMNGDGKLDLVFGPPRKSTLGPTIFLGDRGLWTRWEEARFPQLPYDYGTAAAGDLNGDGHQDIVYGVHLRGILAVAGDGKGSFSDISTGLPFAIAGRDAARFSSKAVSLSDWNGDGRLDIVALGEGPRLVTTPGETIEQSMGIKVFLNESAGRWTVAPDAPGGRHFGDRVLVIDMDDDGKVDAVTASGTIGARDIVQWRNPPAKKSLLHIDGIRPGALILDVATGNLDGNKFPDLVVVYKAFEAGTWRTGADILFQVEKSQWSRIPLGFEKGLEGPSAVAIVSLGGDKIPDIVIGTSNGEVWPFVSDAMAGYTRDETIRGYRGCEVSALRGADFDGDGFDELVATFATEGEGSRCPSAGGVAAWTFRIRAAEVQLEP